MKVEEIIEKLQQTGWRIRIESDEHGYQYFLEGPRHSVTSTELSRLIQDGWLENTANGGGYTLTDEGRKAYLRSTDELGDGNLVPPARLQSCDVR